MTLPAYHADMAVLAFLTYLPPLHIPFARFPAVDAWLQQLMYRDGVIHGCQTLGFPGVVDLFSQGLRYTETQPGMLGAPAQAQVNSGRGDSADEVRPAATHSTAIWYLVRIL